MHAVLQATTDLYGKCTTRHSGTSAAAPEAAGVFALALEAKSVFGVFHSFIHSFIVGFTRLRPFGSIYRGLQEQT